MGETFSVLRHSRFRRYFTGQALSLVGDGLVPLTIAFAALQVAGPDALGLVLATNRVPIAVLVLFGGALGDRWNRRAVLVAADPTRRTRNRPRLLIRPPSCANSSAETACWSRKTRYCRRAAAHLSQDQLPGKALPARE